MRKKFYNRLRELVSTKKDNNFYITSERYASLLKEVKEAKVVKVKQTVHYRRLKRYDVLKIGGEEKLISPVSADNEEILYYVCFDELFNVTHDAHIAVGHGGRTRMIKELAHKYKNVTVETIVTYLRLCETCRKKQKLLKKGFVVKPILHNELNSRCQIDLIDMQTNPDGVMKFILVYQDHLTKFVLLRPMCSKSADEVARHLLDIFSTFGAPNILHSDNGKEFCNETIKSLCKLWIDVKIVHGKPRHSQSQGSIERANQDVENMLAAWMETNNTSKWSEGLPFVQAMKNRAYHEGITCSPYEAMFGVPMKLGLANLVGLRNKLNDIHSEEDLESVINVENELTDDVDNSDLQIAKTEVQVTTTTTTETEQNETTTGTVVSGRAKRFRKTAREGLEKQAKKMKAVSSEKLVKPVIGQNVIIKNPEFDKAKMDPKSLITVVTDIKDDEYYELGTRVGKLAGLYTINQFTLCEENFLNIEDVPTVDKPLTHRTAIKRLSLVGGQGFKRCNCRKKCATKRCLCKSSGLLCNSKCHDSQPCCNKQSI